MKAVCRCGHKVTINIPPDKKDEWDGFAKRCLCKDCYEKKTGRVCNPDTVMVSDLWAK